MVVAHSLSLGPAGTIAGFDAEQILLALVVAALLAMSRRSRSVR